MILEELVGLVASFASVLISQPPQISIEDHQTESTSTSLESWADKIHQEYERENGNELRQETYYYDSTVHAPLVTESYIKPSYLKSLQRSLRANIGIKIAIFPLGLLAIAVLCFVLNTCLLCFEWEYRKYSISTSVMRWQLIGADILVLPGAIWFPLTMALIFGWKEFKSNYISTLYINFVVGAAVIIYNGFLFIFGVYRTKIFYRFPVVVLFIAGIIYSSIVVARKYRKIHPTTVYSNFHICFIISFGFIAGYIIAIIYRYLIFPYFNTLEDGINKAIMVAIIPGFVLIPTAISKYLVLRRSSGVFRPDRSFLLVYYLRGVAIGVYRIMQADFKSLSLFIGLSLLHGISNVFSKATERLRDKIWTTLISCLRRTCCGRRVQLLPLNTPHHRRLKADIEIQNILFEYTTLILSQAYLVLYLITSFDISSWSVIKGSLIRMAIGLGIDFFFNCISVFIQIHYHNVPMRRVWLKCWKRHVIANVIVIMVLINYFTPVLLTVFQTRVDNSGQEQAIRNCTSPFDRW